MKLGEEPFIQISFSGHFPTEPENIKEFKVGDWVLTMYDKKMCPGEVKAVGSEDVQVSVMHRTFQQNWKWPEKPNQIFYKKSDIIKKNVSPHRYKFEERF